MALSNLQSPHCSAQMWLVPRGDVPCRHGHLTRYCHWLQELHAGERHGEGGNRRAEENLTKDTPPNRDFASEGRKWRVRSVMVGFGVFGAPRFSSPEVPKYLFLKGFGTSGRKMGAPQKRQIQPRRIWPPICGPQIAGCCFAPPSCQ